MINYGKHFIDKADIKSVVNVLKSKNLAQGPVVKKFEKSINNYFGSKYALVVSSGTSALYLAGKALGWNEKSNIITSPLTFVAGANVSELMGSSIKFIDIDPVTYCIDTKALEIQLKKNKKKITTVIATDFAGHTCDWKMLKYLSTKYNFTLVNDNCHAVGAEYLGDQKYAVKYADLSTLSFHPVKHFTTGEGGAIFTNNLNLYNKILICRDHGILRKKNLWNYDVKFPSFNFRMSELQASLGNSQIKKINRFLKYRRDVAKIYDKELKDIKSITLPKSINCKNAYHLYPILINFRKLKKSKTKLLKIFFSKKIKLQVHYKPTHLFSYYLKKYKNNKKNLQIAEKFYKEEISLPMFYNLKTKDVYKVIKILKNFILN